ncbi:nuclear transport factor 2 family protein [Ignavibacteria bacterium 4148-Me]|uniref:YybH family protein n=1 Tax=Rosettibacter primus TaxID=3111523 RepID=UPI00336C0402
MKYAFLIFILFVTACTKEVPESEKRIAKTAEEEAIRKLIDHFYTAYNSGDIETAVTLIDENYKGMAADSDDVIGVEALTNELYQYRKEYPEGKWEIRIEELSVQNDLAYAIIYGSFLMPDPIEKRMNPIYSERSIKILKKDKNEGWKIFRSLSIPTLTYN